MSYGNELTAALAAADLAGAVILEHYARFAAIADAPASISTDADRASQETILRHLQTLFPGDAYCAEEDTPALTGASRLGERLWVVDPIDGTRGFAMKNGEFSVMVAFVEGGQVAVGVVLEPASGRLTYAVRGGGCWRRDVAGGSGGVPAAPAVRCRVSSTADLTAATLTQSRSRNPRAPSAPVQALRPTRVLETYSAGIKL